MRAGKSYVQATPQSAVAVPLCTEVEAREVSSHHRVPNSDCRLLHVNHIFFLLSTIAPYGSF